MQFRVFTSRPHKCHVFGRINLLKWYNLHSLIKHQISTRNTDSGLHLFQHSLIKHQIHISHTTSAIQFCQHSLTKHQNSHTSYSFDPPVLQTFTNKTSWHDTHTHIHTHTHTFFQFCQHLLINHQIFTWHLASVLKFCQHFPSNVYIYNVLVYKNKTGNVRIT